MTKRKFAPAVLGCCAMVSLACSSTTTEKVVPPGATGTVASPPPFCVAAEGTPTEPTGTPVTTGDTSVAVVDEVAFAI